MGKMNKRLARLKRKRSIRRRITGSSGRPRLSVFRSAKHVYAQVIDDTEGVTLVSASSLTKGAGEVYEGKAGKELAALVGTAIAEACKEKSIVNVVFDRNGYQYHGRVKALADAAREAGLSF